MRGYSNRRWQATKKLTAVFFAVFALAAQPVLAINVPAAFAAPVVNEVMPNPVTITDTQGEWIEIHNQGTESFDVSGWTLNDGGSESYTFPSGTVLEGDEYYVVCRTMATAEANCDAEWSNMSLLNTGDTVTLENAASEQQDSFTYNASNDGKSVEVVREDNTATGVNNSTSSYGTNGNTGTPGAANNAQPTGGVVNQTTGEHFTTIQAAVNDADTTDGDKILIKSGNYTVSNINVSKELTITGQDHPVLTVPDVTQTNAFDIWADNVTIQGLTIVGPADGTSYKTYAWGGTVTRGVVVHNGAENVLVADNTIRGLRNNILVDGRNTGSITNNEIDNSKSGVSVQYTDAGTGNTENYSMTISDNYEGTYGNEWGLNTHLNGHYVGGSYHPNVPNSDSEKIAVNAPSAVQMALKQNSAANGGWTVQDQGYRYHNRTAVQVGGAGAADTNQGSPLGQLATAQAGADAVVAGGLVEINSNLTLSHQLTLLQAVTVHGNNHALTGAFTKTDNDNNAVIGVQSDDVSISDLTVDGVNGDTNKLHGINVYESDNVTLSDITAVNGRSGVVVGQGSTVTIHGIQTSGNVWHGINVDKPGAHLTISGSNTHSEARPIFVDDKTVGVVVDEDSQYSIFDDGTSYTYVLTSEVEDEDGDVTLPVSGGEATTPINHSTTLSLGNTTVVIPAGTKVTAEGNPAWDGVISAPTAVTTGVNLPSGTTLGLGIEVGSSETKLTFDKAVKLVFTDQKGKLVGWQQGSGAFTPITVNCSAYLPNLDDNMPDGGDCKTTEDNDLVVWTKHFTTFATYTTKKTTGGAEKSPSVTTTSGSTFTPTTVFAESFGTSNNGTKSSNGIKDNGEVLGKKTTYPKKNTASVNGKDNSNLIFGLAWYWWVVILAAIGAVWWLVSAWRNRRDTL